MMEFIDFANAFKEGFNLDSGVQISPEMDLSELLEWNSMAVVNSIVFFDEFFKIDVDAEDVKGCKTINDLYKLIEE